MLKKFENHIIKRGLFEKKDLILVAFSGGIDSVVLTDLLHKAGYNFSVAHCNFMLRGPEANEDTAFCEAYANALNIPFYVNYFDTKIYANTHKLSIQMAARELRYNWFNDLIKEHNFKYVLTAHHANDNVETLLINLLRGTGIKGLQGIPEKQNYVVRPLLFATKQHIINYAQQHDIVYREDSSNKEIKYTRNFIRQNIVTELKKINPTLEETISTSVNFFKQSTEIVAAYTQLKYTSICQDTNNILKINIPLLLNEPQKETLLFEWLYFNGFKATQIEQLVEVLGTDNAIGKQFSTATHQLVIDRQYILIKALPTKEPITHFSINDSLDIGHLPINLNFEKKSVLNFSTNHNQIQIENTPTLFPLTLRKWRQGDKFIPFGMKGSKKLSDFFKDKKLSLFEKEATWILETHEHIVWIVGHRMDDRCKVKEGANNIITITVEDI